MLGPRRAAQQQAAPLRGQAAPLKARSTSALTPAFPDRLQEHVTNGVENQWLVC